jgi:hypothetical protein
MKIAELARRAERAFRGQGGVCRRRLTLSLASLPG